MGTWNACSAHRGRRCAAIAVAVLLMACQGLANPSASRADDGQVTVNRTLEGTAGYRAYPVFAADMRVEGADSVATHIAWSSDAAKDVVVAFLQKADPRTGARVHADYEGGDDPQKAAEYIGAKIAQGAVDEAAGTEPATPAAGSFAMELAQALAASALDYETATSGVPFTGQTGYWLFVSDTPETGTAPLWVPLGGAAPSVLAKEAAPTVRKEVREDSSGEWGAAADASTGEDLDYRITATMPSNLGALRGYHLNIVDTLPAGMSLAGGTVDTVRVYADGVDITAQAHVDWAGRRLTVDIADMRALSEMEVTRDTVVRVEYRAHLDAACSIGREGNRNGVTMAYTSDPVSLGEGSIDGPITQTYSYGLSIDKCDKATGDSLAHARYTLEVADTQAGPDGSGIRAFADGNAGRYVQADGSLSADPFEFETGEDGVFSVRGLDAGTYVVHEAAAPEGYELQDADITFVLSSSFEGAELAGLVAVASGGEQSKTAEADIVTHVARVDEDSGIAELQTSDDKKVVLPLTGMEGATGLYLAGAGLAVFAVAGLLVLRRRERMKRSGA